MFATTFRIRVVVAARGMRSVDVAVAPCGVRRWAHLV
jgi:hypothetical protein